MARGEKLPKGCVRSGNSLDFSRVRISEGEADRWGAQIALHSDVLKIVWIGTTLNDAAAQFINVLLTWSPSLESIALGSGSLSIRGVHLVADGLKRNEQLVKATLRDSRVGDLGCRAIASVLIANTALRELDLSNTQIGLQGARHLSNALQMNKNLRVLNMTGNPLGLIGCALLQNVSRSGEALETRGLHTCHDTKELER